jgi:hypothetical protein
MSWPVAGHPALFRQPCLAINVPEHTYFEQYMAGHTLNSMFGPAFQEKSRNTCRDTQNH